MKSVCYLPLAPAIWGVKKQLPARSNWHYPASCFCCWRVEFEDLLFDRPCWSHRSGGCGRGGAVFLLGFGWSWLSIAKKKFSVVKSPISYPLARRNSSFDLELFVCSREQFRTTNFYSTMSRCIGSNKETIEAHCHLLARKMKNLKKALSMRVQNEKSGFHHKVKLSAGQW